MFNKLLRATVPTCVTFGPLFMTRIAGTAAPRYGDDLVPPGVLMLSLGLVGICRIIASQQRAIRHLKDQFRESSQPKTAMHHG